MACATLAVYTLLASLVATGIASNCEIELEPAYTGLTETADFTGLIYMVPTGIQLNAGYKCTTNTVYGTPQPKCGGSINLDLSSCSKLKITFKARSGTQIQIEGNERTRLEFQLKSPNCGSGNPYPFQNIAGSEFTPIKTGSATDKLTYSASTSFVDVGRGNITDGGDGTTCEVFTRVQYDAPATGTFTSISWEVALDTNKIPAGNLDYTFGTDLYCWIRDPSASRRRSVGDRERRVTNTLSIVPINANAASTASASVSVVAVTALAVVAVFLA